MYRVVRTEYNETGMARKRYDGNGNGGSKDKQLPQKVKPSGEFCVLSQMVVGVGDPRRMTAIVGEKEIIFLRDKLAELLFSHGLPIPSGLHISVEFNQGAKVFDIEGYLRQTIAGVAGELSPEAQKTIESAMNVADRIGINIDLGSIVAQSKPQEA